MKKEKILILGSSNMDLVLDVDHMPVAGETILANSKMTIPGGKGANQAYAAACLGGDIIFLSVVGEDEDGQYMRANLERAGVDVSYMKTVKDIPSGTTVLTVNKEGDNSIIVVQGANSRCDQEYLASIEEPMQECRIVMAQLEVPLSGVYETLKSAKAAGKITILDPAPAPDFIPDDVLQCVDYLTPNETELAFLTGVQTKGIDSVEQGARLLLKKGAQNVIVTLGEQGILLANSDGAKLFPALEVKAVDSTAAGDTFNAAFAVGLSEGKDVEESILFANRASAITVCRYGAQASIPTRMEADNFLGIID